MYRFKLVTGWRFQASLGRSLALPIRCMRRLPMLVHVSVNPLLCFHVEAYRSFKSNNGLVLCHCFNSQGFILRRTAGRCLHNGGSEIIRIHVLLCPYARLIQTACAAAMMASLMSFAAHQLRVKSEFSRFQPGWNYFRSGAFFIMVPKPARSEGWWQDASTTWKLLYMAVIKRRYERALIIPAYRCC